MGPRYDSDALAEIHEQIQTLNYILSAVNTEKGKTNPIPKPQQYPRMNEVLKRDTGD